MNWQSLSRSLVAVLLASGCTSRDRSEVAREIADRERYAAAMLVDAGALSALHVSSSSNVRFEEGFSLIQFDPPDDRFDRDGLDPLDLLHQRPVRRIRVEA